jgi:serine/threonine-protein phosphatase 2A regulatory subunit A
MGDLNPFDFFRQETSNVDVLVRSDAMNKVNLILALMGPERARNDMIPYFLAKISNESDEVLLALSNRIGDFTKYIGGPDYIHLLIPLIELLCNAEEVTVRNAIVASIQNILKVLPAGNSASLSSTHRSLSSALTEMYKRLAFEDTASDVFYSRSSAAIITPDVYRILIDSDRAVVKELFFHLSTKDEVSLVKRAALSSFPKMLEILEPELIPTEFLNLLKSAFTDEVSIVRIMATENISQYCVVLSNIANNKTERFSAAAQETAKALLNQPSSELIELIKSSYSHTSWKMRQAIAKTYGKLVSCFTDANILKTELFPGLIAMIQDPEPEVRGASLENVGVFLGPIESAAFLAEFIPIANELTRDPVTVVRKTLAEVVVDIAVRLAPELVAQNISDIIIRILSQDEDPLVRMRIIKKLPKIAEETPSLCTRLTDYIKQSFKDTNWRLRKEVVLALPAVTRHMSSDYFTEQFLQLYIEKLKDNVDEVRLAYATSIGNLFEYTGPDFILEKLYFPLRGMNAENNLVKISMIRIIEGVMQKLSPNLEHKIKSDLLTIAINCSTFKVPNVRLAVAQCLGTASLVVGSDLSRNMIKPVLAELVQDKDKDVAYFAAIAMKNCPP